MSKWIRLPDNSYIKAFTLPVLIKIDKGDPRHPRFEIKLSKNEYLYVDYQNFEKRDLSTLGGPVLKISFHSFSLQYVRFFLAKLAKKKSDDTKNVKNENWYSVYKQTFTKSQIKRVRLTALIMSYFLSIRFLLMKHSIQLIFIQSFILWQAYRAGKRLNTPVKKNPYYQKLLQLLEGAVGASLDECRNNSPIWCRVVGYVENLNWLVLVQAVLVEFDLNFLISGGGLALLLTISYFYFSSLVTKHINLTEMLTLSLKQVSPSAIPTWLKRLENYEKSHIFSEERLSDFFKSDFCDHKGISHKNVMLTVSWNPENSHSSIFLENIEGDGAQREKRIDKVDFYTLDNNTHWLYQVKKVVVSDKEWGFLSIEEYWEKSKNIQEKKFISRSRVISQKQYEQLYFIIRHFSRQVYGITSNNCCSQVLRWLEAVEILDLDLKKELSKNIPGRCQYIKDDDEHEAKYLKSQLVQCF